MQVNTTCWQVDTPYDETVENHWQSQTRFICEFRTMNGWSPNDIKWIMGSGYATGGRFHRWIVRDEDAAMRFMLACGREIKKVEVKV